MGVDASRMRNTSVHPLIRFSQCSFGPVRSCFSRITSISSTRHKEMKNVLLIGGETPIRMFDCFSELVSNYLTDADLLFDKDEFA